MGDPKGWPMKDKKPAEVAAQEAFEEAGLIGNIVGKKPLGNFHYPKKLTQRAILCEVRVYLFRVEQQRESWPEMSQRETRWFDANEAAELVDESGLAAIIGRFAGSRVRFFTFRRESAARKRRLLGVGADPRSGPTAGGQQPHAQEGLNAPYRHNPNTPWLH
jgi:ADP-ribose pyrophosphatase YjhB (NUDIX family)